MKNPRVRLFIEIAISVGVIVYFAFSYFLGIRHQPGSLWIKSDQLLRWIQIHQPLIVDLREENEPREVLFRNDELLHRPFLSLIENPDSLSLPRNRPVLFICSDGNRSRLMATLFHEKGFNSYYLLDGMKGFNRHLEEKKQSP